MDIFALEKQFRRKDCITRERIYSLLPRVMKEAQIDMWLILAAEYNEDPVFASLVPGIISNASRLTCMVFYLEEEGTLDAVSINKPSRAMGHFYRQLAYNTDRQWEAIKQYIEEKNPKKIGINISEVSALGAGLSYALYEELKANLGEALSEKLVSADALAVGYLEHLIEEEKALYPAIYKITTDVMTRAFSRETIVPGITTTEELEFWAADEFRKRGLVTCFPPTINLQRQGREESMISGVIEPGDLLHYDAGIEFLGLCTDLQRLAYVLKPGEADAPEGIKRGFWLGREFGYLAAEEFCEGRTGNEVFLKTMEKTRERGIRATLYSHPIGKHCHGAGPTIGLYDKQEPIPGKGDRRLSHHTAFALEYNVLTHVEEWNQDVYFYLEETVLFSKDGQLEYLDKAYQDLILI